MTDQLPVDLLSANVPDALRSRKQWLVWRLEANEGEKKPRKMPYYASGGRRTGEQGSEKDRSKLVDFVDALAVLAANKCTGIGFAFLPGDELIGIDLDNAVDAQTGEISERARAIIDSCASYTEYSPSRRGFHIICTGESETFKSNSIGVEVFSGRQFFTVTGQRVPETQAQVGSIAEKVLRRLRATVDQAKNIGDASAPAAAPAISSQGDNRSDIESALAVLSPDCGYDQWINIGMALQAELGDAGFGAFNYWSSRGQSYKSEADCRSHWKSFGRKAGVTAATIFKLARQQGWTKPRQKRAKPAASQEPLTPGIDLQQPLSGFEADWRMQMRRNDAGGLRQSQGNIDLVLRNDDAWRGLLGYDEFSYRIIKRSAPPFEGGSAGPWEETDAIKTAIWIERKYALTVKSKLVDEVVRSIAWDNRFHIVRDWLDSIESNWDRVERLPTFMQDAFGAEQNSYTEHIGCGLLVSAVARIYRPGCKVDTMVVLEGSQGTGKSTALIELFSPSWYVDIIDPPSHKDFYITLQGAWCVEIGEMQSFSRADVNHVKQAITRRDDKFRAPYDKAATDHPRHSIFVGTTNADTYLMDATGGRRFLPAKCSQANLQYIRDQREQLFAEAVALFRAGFKWWAFPSELAQAEQDQRYVEDSWAEPIQLWVIGDSSYTATAYPDPLPRPTKDSPIDSITTTQVLQFALRTEISKHTRQDQMRVSQIMRRLGYERAPQRRVPDLRERIRPWVRMKPAISDDKGDAEPLPI